MPITNYAYAAAYNPATYRPTLDPMGLLPANFVTGEKQTITAANARDFHFIVPLFAPFFAYAGALVVVHTPSSGPSKTLVEGIDYNLAFQFIGATRACAKPVYGGITFLNTQLAGVITLAYHALGGNWTINQPEINRILADRVVNPRVTAWEQVVDRPLLFPVIDHEWNLQDLVGAKDIVFEIQHVADAIASKVPGQLGAELTSHLNDYANPHRTTKTQVGLGNVPNYSAATSAEAVAGIASDRFMTPATTASVIAASEAKGNGSLLIHTQDLINPHATTKAQVGLGNVDNYATATVAEALAGTATDRFMTPAAVTAIVQKSVNNADGGLNAHLADTNNPHLVSKDQVGLSDVMNYPVATSAEALDGSSSDRYMTPVLVAKVVHVLELATNSNLADHLNNENNPHAVTKAQAGLSNVANYATATNAEAIAGTATNLFVTPATMNAAISSNVPVAANTVQGKVALNLGNAPGDDANSVDALTSAGLNAILASSTPNAIQQAIKAGLPTTKISAAAKNFTTVKPDGLYSTQESIELVGDAQSIIKMRDGSFGAWSFYDVKDPDLGIYNYTVRLDGGVFGVYMSAVNTPYDQGVAKFTVDYNGNALASGNVTAYSDPRLKENIRPISNAIEKVKLLNGVYFTWKDVAHVTCKAGKQDVGILANEVQAVFPEIVSDSIAIEGQSYKTVAYDKLIPVLIEAIKELNARVEALEAEKRYL
jgi:hypothetical protein